MSAHFFAAIAVGMPAVFSCTVKVVEALPDILLALALAVTLQVPTGSCFLARQLYTAVPFVPVNSLSVTRVLFAFAAAKVPLALASRPRAAC